MTDPFELIPNPESVPLSERLRLRLCYLSYFAFALCMIRILKELGYTNIPIPDRRSFKGRTPTAGKDLQAWKKDELGMHRVYVQLKRWRKVPVVPRACIDNLRGVQLADGVPEGIIISTVGFSREARDAAAAFPGRKLTLIDGDNIGRLCERYRIGVVEKTDLLTGQTRLEFDESSFLRLEADAARLKGKPRQKRRDRG